MDTIAAISTALGVGAISIVRVSGEDSINIVNRIFKGPDLTKVQSHTIHYGYIVDKKQVIDEVLVSVMLSPKTFTTENIVEINSHGGIATTNKVLELLLLNGARLAEPGEFTKRAFLNGRIDLVEADGIMNLIEELTTDKILPKLCSFQSNLEQIIKDSHDGKIINEGINVGIIGRPNVGKSSLLNALLEEEKAIVTDIEGTTRDIVEGKITLNGVILNIIDTAGIRETDNVVEKIGVQKSKEMINKCDLIILMLNHNEELNQEDLNLISTLKNKKSIILINKIDLDKKLDRNQLKDNKYIELSIKENKGIDVLKQRIIEIFNLGNLETKDLTYLSDARSIALLKKSLSYIQNAIFSIQQKEPIDIVEFSIKDAWETLGEIIGETYKEELIDELFSRFCLGK